MNQKQALERIQRIIAERGDDPQHSPPVPIHLNGNLVAFAWDSGSGDDQEHPELVAFAVPDDMEFCEGCWNYWPKPEIASVLAERAARGDPGPDCPARGNWFGYWQARSNLGYDRSLCPSCLADTLAA